MSDEEAEALHDELAVPGSGEPIFQAAPAADLNPGTEAKVDSNNPKRGPQLIIDSGRRAVADTGPAFVKSVA